VPEVLSSQQGNATGKRKRGGDTAEDEENEDEIDDEDEEEDEDEEDEESEPEEAPVKKNTKPKAAAPKKVHLAKKAKVNGNASHAKAPAVKLPNRPKKPVGKVVFKDKDAEGLYGRFNGVHSELAQC